MNSPARPAAFILFAIIIIGGFGIARTALVRHDPIGLLAIVLALVLAWRFKRLATLQRIAVPRTVGVPRPKLPVRLAIAARDSFEVFPGQPEGYVGYTDFTAMSVEVNDDLVGRRPAEQYALVGFGNGFLLGIRTRQQDGDDKGRVHFRVIDASQTCRESLGWLAYLQRSGTDNAGPSTENLHSVIRSASTAIASQGPITMAFWDKVHNKRTESLDASGTTPRMLEDWTNTYQAAFIEGHRQALGAVIVAQPN